MLLFENIKLALSAIKANKLRSFLTMLGIIIGISSVIAIASIGSSMKAAIAEEVKGFKGQMIMMPNYKIDDVEFDYNNDLIKEEEVEKIKEKFPDMIKYISPDISATATTTVDRKNAKLRIEGESAGIFKFDVSKKLVYGRDISEGDVRERNEVAIISLEMARSFFRKENAVGKSFSCKLENGYKDLVVIGVYKKEPSLFSGMSRSDIYEIKVPYKIMTDGYGESYFKIYSETSKDQQMQADLFKNYVNKMKGKKDLYICETAESQIGVINRILGIISLAIGAIAAISLLVGGIGIMNIMLVSVTERTREIGIRKALGAGTSDIMTQFLIESVILSIMGGIIGVFLGIGIASIGMIIAKTSLVINPLSIIIAVIFSGAVGIIFGILPAGKAAKLDPIQCLRYE